ncbi:MULTISPECIES: FecR domain-containing protein [Asticcacaulis]|uniref:FecR family protein n=1 Tax=Asticcacaulis TaxID=76890 RepID=UPI001AE15745|nr:MULTISPECIES: FecR domain-containing protein [Asticcacaulis]MBP2161019.1 transmembrane sensor [Asticcacaulis solisilvae]MDR6802064.1 transmembrane sensor [Asticcacaulis sp. BE141]
MSRIDAEAAEWVARRAGTSDPEIEQAFQAWHDADRRHAGAYLRAEAAWILLDRAQVLTHGVGAAIPQHDVLSSPLVTPLPAPSRAPAQPSRRHALMGGLAASALAVLGVGYAMSRRASYETRRGELRNVPLSDRSLAAINTDSHVEVAMGESSRKVQLVKGEAWFEVAKNPDAPFVVSAGDIRVRAIGTAFSVRRHANGADVLVTEGTVETWSVRDPEKRTRLSAGSRAFVAAETAEPVAVVAEAAEIDRKLAWREREIILREESLSAAASDFNRYNDQQIIIADERLLDVKLVGGFQVDRPEAFARAVHSAFGVPVSIRHDRIIIGTQAASS